MKESREREADGMNDADTQGVAILLATYNGARFLPAQLASFAAQTHTAWRLYWRDDGSSDGSPALVEDFGHAAGARRCAGVGGTAHLGAARGFFALLRAASAGPETVFAFSDQDDIWLPEKLADGVRALASVRPGQPGLYFCGRILADQDGRPTRTVPPPARPPGFPAALTQNVIPGCCMMVNRAAARLILAFDPPPGTWHDWWCYLIVAANNGTIVGGGKPGILYRQHDRNLIGETGGFWGRTIRAFGRGRRPFMTLLRAHVAALSIND